MLHIEQQTAKNKIMQGEGHLLTARAGCGKSFLTANIIIDHLTDNEHSAVTIIAPCHTARAVIEQEIKQQNSSKVRGGNSRIYRRINSMTVAAAVGKLPNLNAMPSSVQDTPFVCNAELGALTDSINKDVVNLLVIEEISMVSKHDLNKILTIWNENSKQYDILLMVGDFRQIPPVNGRSCKRIISEMINNWDLEHHKLTVNHRSGKSTGIPEFSEKVYSDFKIKGDSTAFPDVTVYDDASIFNNAYVDKINTNAQSITAIAFTNKRVNQYIKNASNCATVDFKKGDLIRLHESININFRNRDGKWITQNVANNGEIINIREYTPYKITQISPFENKVETTLIYTHPWVKNVELQYGVVELDIKHPDPTKPIGEYVKGCVPHRLEDGINSGKESSYIMLFSELLKTVTKMRDSLDSTRGGKDSEYVKNQIRRLTITGFDSSIMSIWNDYNVNFAEGSAECTKRKKALLTARCFYGQRSQFSNVTKLYALTAHKSQGQSVDIVFADLRDIERAGEPICKNLGFVACSRAKHELHVLY